MTCPIILIGAMLLLATACDKKSSTPPPTPPAPAALQLVNATLKGEPGPNFVGVGFNPVVRFHFNQRLDKATANAVLTMSDDGGTATAFGVGWERGDSTPVVTPGSNASKGLTRYSVVLTTALKSAAGTALDRAASISFHTRIDSAAKFPAISNDSLLTLVQRQTFRYFWDFAHPASGLARERNTSGDLVTSGGSGFGMMAIVTAIHRGFITRQQGLARLQLMVDFLKNKAQRFKGAYPHWMNGNTGVGIPFSANDNGADLVETSFLAMGLIAAREYFDNAAAAEQSFRSDINSILNGIEWNWFRKNNEQVLYWHWSPDRGWAINLKIRGWNECLLTYVLAAGTTQHSIPDTVYHKGFARNGAQRNGRSFYSINLPLGEDFGGPLFYAHYSFLGINPHGLQDQYADYWAPQVAHSRINFEYCKANPLARYGYSASCWGLTASDIPNGYTASSPRNDVGVIAPTAAVSSLPYTPAQSMDAIRFFYYTLGDRLWKDYGFVDAFKLSDLWFAASFLAIDQSPQIIMIENYRSGLLWNLCSRAPEVKAGLRKLGFTAPYL